jgi:hypothetical protein
MIVTSALISGGVLQSPADAPSGIESPAVIKARPAPVGAGRPYLAPVPDCEPPFDDERSAVSRLRRLRVAARSAALVRTIPDTVKDPAVPGWSQDADMGVRRTATASLPAATRSGPVLARALVEVMSGQRPLSQLRVHCAPDVFAGLQARPVLRGALGHLLNVRVCEPADGAAEISVVFRRGERVRALAFRIQGVDGRWRITALQTG